MAAPNNFILPTLEALAVQQLAERLAYADEVIAQRNLMLSALPRQIEVQQCRFDSLVEGLKALIETAESAAAKQQAPAVQQDEPAPASVGISWDASGSAYRKGDCHRAACEINPCNGSCKTRAPELDRKHPAPVTQPDHAALLKEAAELFRFYEKSHRARGPEHLAKAERNAEIAGRIESALAQPAPVAQPLTKSFIENEYLKESRVAGAWTSIATFGAYLSGVRLAERAHKIGTTP